MIKDRPAAAADHELPGAVQYGDSFNLCSDDTLYRLLVLSSILPHYTVTKNSNSKWIVAKTSNTLFFHSIIMHYNNNGTIMLSISSQPGCFPGLTGGNFSQKIIDNRINEIVHLLYYL